MNKLPSEDKIKEHIELMFGPGAEADFSQYEKGEGFSVAVAGDEFGGISVHNGEFWTYIVVDESETILEPKATQDKIVLKSPYYFHAMRELAVQMLYRRWETICEQ